MPDTQVEADVEEPATYATAWITEQSSAAKRESARGDLSSRDQNLAHEISRSAKVLSTLPTIQRGGFSRSLLRSFATRSYAF